MRIASCSLSRRAIACRVRGLILPSFEAETKAEEGVRAKVGKPGFGAVEDVADWASVGGAGVSETMLGPSIATIDGGMSAQPEGPVQARKGDGQSSMRRSGLLVKST